MNDKEYIKELEATITVQDMTIAKANRIIVNERKRKRELLEELVAVKQDCIGILILFNDELKKQQQLVAMYRRQTDGAI